MEPHNLTQWNTGTSYPAGRLFTCARPGRCNNKSGAVSNEKVHDWVEGLPNGNTVIISLLGRKQDENGKSEFAFYNQFCGKEDNSEERRGRIPFQEWLDYRCKTRSLKVIEHPTYDGKKIELKIMAAIAADIRHLLGEGYTVVVMDSGGVQRCGEVCQHLGFARDVHPSHRPPIAVNSPASWKEQESVR